jgi:ribosome recycling factor
MEELKVYEEKMNKTLDVLLSDYGTIRAGRANPHVLDKIKVDYYGTPTPLQQVGNISVPEARMIVIQPWEKSLLKAIEKAIMTSELGINPTNDGSCIRLIFPEMTEERRKDVAKEVKKKGDNAKVAIRNIRRDANDAFKKKEKAGEMSEDTLAEATEKMQKLTDKMIEKVDKAVEEKTKEIMTV